METPVVINDKADLEAAFLAIRRSLLQLNMRLRAVEYELHSTGTLTDILKDTSDATDEKGNQDPREHA